MGYGRKEKDQTHSIVVEFCIKINISEQILLNFQFYFLWTKVSSNIVIRDLSFHALSS
jgi:hypothetical protein